MLYVIHEKEAFLTGAPSTALNDPLHFIINKRRRSASVENLSARRHSVKPLDLCANGQQCCSSFVTYTAASEAIERTQHGQMTRRSRLCNIAADGDVTASVGSAELQRDAQFSPRAQASD